jgi:hypothetical protein
MTDQRGTGQLSGSVPVFRLRRDQARDEVFEEMLLIAGDGCEKLTKPAYDLAPLD